MSIKDLKGKPLEIAQEWLRLNRNDRNSVMEAVSLEIVGYPRPMTLREFTPALIWSRRPVEVITRFFAEPVGYGGQGWSQTNMLVGSMLCSPCSFKREEIRLYAGHRKDAERLASIVKGLDDPAPWGGLCERRGQANTHRLARDVPVAHVPLPEPEHPVQREDARKLLELVNGGRLPCALWKVPYSISTLECFMLEAEISTPIDGFKEMDLIAVYVGTLVAPPPSDMRRA